MSIFSRAVDGFLSKISLFFVGLVIGGYYCFYTVDIILFAVVFSICVGQIYIELSRGKSAPKPSKFVGAVIEKLRFTPVADTTTALLRALDFLWPQLVDGKIVVNDTVIHIAFYPQTLSATDIYSLVGSSKYARHLILASGVSADGQDFCNRWGGKIRTLVCDDAVEFFRKANALPPISVPSGKEKRAKILGSIFSRARAKSYFTCALIVMILSFFTMRSLYFIIFSSLAFALGVISLFSRKKA